MKNVSALVPLFMSAFTAAQPVLQSGDISYVPGESFTESVCSWIPAGAAGANQNWNFSALGCAGSFTSNWVAPPTAPDFPTATVASASQSFLGFYRASPTSFQYLGYAEGISLTSVVLDDPADEVRYPFAYGDAYTDTYSGLGYSPDGAGGQNTTPISGTLFVEADAYGTLQLPWGSVENVLRLHKVRTSANDGIVEEEYRFYQPGIHHPWLRSFRRTVNGNLQTESMRYWSPAPSGVEETIMAAPLRIHPNPVSDYFTAPMIGADAVISICDLTGRRIPLAVNRRDGHVIVDASMLPAGAYTIQLLDLYGQRTARFIKQ